MPRSSVLWPEPVDTSVWTDAVSTAGRPLATGTTKLGCSNEKRVPKSPTNHTPPEIVEKAFYLRSKYHFGSMRAV